MLVNVNLLSSNNQLESRMREIRQYGSVGGESPQRDFPTPIVNFQADFCVGALT